MYIPKKGHIFYMLFSISEMLKIHSEDRTDLA